MNLLKGYVPIVMLMFLLAGCTAQQKYYKNTRYTGNIQGHLNRDLAYCHTIAQGMAPTTTPYIPPSPTTTHGTGIVTDNHGNVYTGVYNQTTYPNENMMLIGSMNSFARAVQSSNAYQALKNRCLYELGWYEISKEEYANSNALNSSIKGQAKFTSSPSGASVYARSGTQLQFNLLPNRTTPFILTLPPNTTHWLPECYKAVLNGQESDIICRDSNEISRIVHFTFNSSVK